LTVAATRLTPNVATAHLVVMVVMVMVMVVPPELAENKC
jgi:hypothetical protein